MNNNVIVSNHCILYICRHVVWRKCLSMHFQITVLCYASVFIRISLLWFCSELCQMWVCRIHTLYRGVTCAFVLQCAVYKIWITPAHIRNNGLYNSGAHSFLICSFFLLIVQAFYCSSCRAQMPWLQLLCRDALFPYSFDGEWMTRGQKSGTKGENTMWSASGQKQGEAVECCWCLTFLSHTKHTLTTAHKAHLAAYAGLYRRLVNLQQC